MRSLLTRVLPLAVAFAVALGGPPAEAQSPFAGGVRIAVNEAGQAVVAWRSVGGARAVVGDKIASTVATVPLTAGGTVFSLVVDQPGAYGAELHFTPAVGPLSYGGQSDEAMVSP